MAARFFEVFGTQVDVTKLEPVAVLAQDDLVISVLEIESTVKRTGRQIRDTEIHLWRFDDDGKVSSFRHVLDTHQHLLAVEAGASTL